MADDTNGGRTRRRVLAGTAGVLGLGAAGLYLTADTAADVDDYPADFSADSGQSDGLGIAYADRPVMGSLDADRRLFAWSDYQCPYCRRFDGDTLPELAENHVATGDLAIVFLDLPLLGERSLSAGVVSKAVWRAVRDDDPNAWGRFHRYVFSKQGPENGEWAAESNLLSYAAVVDGVPGETVERLVVDDRDALAASVRADASVAFDDLGIERGAPVFALSNPSTGDWTSIRGSQPVEAFRDAMTQLGEN
ncbi:thioredoxin domain-containing protein [Halorubellus sp. PRR65]|uniref:DsbA family protein n=1 Tax=Halorubellus sp. PRR65 TaxID=3098148 RepID=UPI002B25C4A9|nr:thioredoxin domain-containing protein [Halorubellus sp. PRR65]